MPFRPKKKGQYVPVTSTSKRDCVADVTARLMARATLGRIDLEHDDIRRKSGAPSTRGLHLSEAEQAAAAWGVDLQVVMLATRNMVRETLIGGSAVGMTGHTKITINSELETNDYYGPHEVYGNELRLWPAGERCPCPLNSAVRHEHVLVEDPGTTAAGYKLWPADTFYRFGEAYSGVSGRSNILVSRDTEGRKMTLTADTWTRAKPGLVDKDGRRIKAVRRLNNGRVVATVYTVNGLDNPDSAWAKTADGDYIRGVLLR